MSAPTTPRPEFLEPLPSPKARSVSPKPSPSNSTSSVNLEAHETYIEENYLKPFRAQQAKNYDTYLAAEWDSLSFWESRLELLERLKWPYVKKRAWSAEIIARVEELNREIEEAEQRISELSSFSDDDS